MKLKTWRTAQEISQAQLAVKWGKTQQQINYWERPNVSISVTTAKWIAKKTDGHVRMEDW